MKSWFPLTLILGLAVPGMAQLRVSPARITTGLRWDIVAGGLYSYSGTTLTVSGNSGVVKWTIKDQNGTVITTLSTSGGKTLGWLTTAATPPDHTAVFGQIDCTGSASNTVCIYNAPAEYPLGETATLVASSESSSASVSVTFTFAYNLQEYFKHRARMLGFNAKPVSKLVVGSNPTRYQPELLVFGCGSAFPIECQIIQADNDALGSQFPSTAGSAGGRPSWTYDGKWFSWNSGRCIPEYWCQAEPGDLMIAQTDGSNLQSLGTAVPGGFAYTYGYDKPNWLITSDASHIYVDDLSNRNAQTCVVTYSGTKRTLNSIVSGPKALYFQPNASSCSPIQASCSVNAYIYDFFPCEASLVSGCATLSATWNTYFGLNFGWDNNGNQHCTIDGGGHNCEYHVHDMELIRGTTDTGLNYGSRGEAGEAIGYRIPSSGTGITALFPNQANNVPYMSHPVLNWSGDLIAYGGQQHCTPSGHTCTNNTWGEGVWQLSSNKPVAFAVGASYGHGTWDGFDNNHYAHDGRGGGSCQASHWCLQSSFINYRARSIRDTTALDFGVRSSGGFGLVYGPTQSPDATKIAESMPTGFSVADQFVGWVAVVAKPAPPVNVSLISSSTATLGWYANPLNHEAKAYHVYKQPSCSGPWERLADVAAVYLQQTQYTYTDTGLSSGSDACYGVSTSDWSGIEGNTLSAILRITNTSGTFAAALEPFKSAGTISFDTTAPGTPSSIAATLVRLTPPNAPTAASQTTGGTLADGKYWIRFAYCNYFDFPANTMPRCTPMGTAGTITISGGGGRAAINNLESARGDMYGQSAIQLYVGGPSWREPSETLQTCSGQPSTVTLPWPPNAWAGQVTGCTLASIASGSAPPSSNTTIVGYRLSWTGPSDNDVRYYALYSRDTAPPVLSKGAYAAQQWLIATVPAGTASYLDYTINWMRAYSGADGPYYGIVAVDRVGNRSAPVCLRADTGESVPCN